MVPTIPPPDTEEQKKERELHMKAGLALQIREVFEHAWYLGERVHHEVTVSEAMLDWTSSPVPARDGNGITTQAKEYRSRFEQNWPDIEKMCLQECGSNCLGPRGCKLPLYKIHDLLKD